MDEILILTLRTNEIDEAFKIWLEKNRPSGGPEQFLSRDLKVELLKAVTKELVEISDDDIEKIFPR